MRKEKTLINLLRGLVDLLTEESARNPEFAAKVANLLADLPEKRKSPRRLAEREHLSAESLPDIHSELNARGETEFRLWLREQPIPVLRAIIRVQDLDSTGRTAKWKEAQKLAEFIADSLRARLLRGSAFIGRTTPE
jgi:hypothetical protein